MNRLAIITVGKTHSGKTTFAKKLEKALDHSFVMDQDNNAAFINEYYRKLLSKTGPNLLKYALSKTIIHHAKAHTNLHIISSNSNLGKKGRQYLLEELYPKNEFIRILVYFDLSFDMLKERVAQSKRSTKIFRHAQSTFEEVLLKQQNESRLVDYMAPVKEEADYLFVIKDPKDIDAVIKEIVHISK